MNQGLSSSDDEMARTEKRTNVKGIQLDYVFYNSQLAIFHKCALV